MDKTKIEECKKLILNMLLIAEGGNEAKSHNYNKYKADFEAMSDDAFVDFISAGILRVKVLPLQNTFELENVLKSYKKTLGRDMMEKVTLPFLYDDPELGSTISDKKQLILKLPVIKLMQTAQGENRYASDISRRDKSNQVVNESKGASISDIETAMLLSGGYDKVVQELFTFRADNDIAKREAYANIVATGRTNIPEAPDEGKVALKYIRACYYGMGINPEF